MENKLKRGNRDTLINTNQELTVGRYNQFFFNLSLAVFHIIKIVKYLYNFYNLINAAYY